MAKNDIYLVKQNTDGTWQEIPIGDNLGDSPMTYDDNFTLHINTKLRVDELEVNGLTTVKDQDVTTSEQLLITNDGTGTAVVINQIGLDGLIDIQDDGETALFIRGDNAFGGFVGLGTKEAQEQLHITGSMLLEHQQLIMSYNDANTKTPVLGINGDNFTELSNVGSGIKFSTGDSTTSPKVTILENGNVGVGTESPQSELHIESNIANHDTTLKIENRHGDSGGTAIEFQGYRDVDNDHWVAKIVADHVNSTAHGGQAIGSNLGFYTYDGSSGYGSPRMTIDQNGNVGIGTTDPQEPLHIETGSDTVVRLTQVLGTSGNDQSHIAFYTKDQTNESIMGRMGIFTDPNDSNVDEALFLNSHDSNNIVFRTGSATRMLIQNSTGNVGIGTTSPDQPFTVKPDTDGRYGIHILKPEAGEVSLGGIFVEADGTSSLYLKDRDAINATTGASTIRLKAKGDSYFLGGNVGIGTPAPDSLLHLKHTKGAATDGFNTLKLESPDPTILLSDSTNTGDMSIMWQAAPNSTGLSNQDGGLLFYRDGDTSDVNFMINTDGNVGIATTNPATLLDLNQPKNDAQGNALNKDVILSFSKGETGEARIGLAGANSQVLFGALTNDLCIRSDGNNIRFGTASATRSDVTIDSSGRVGIGTTSPSSTLEVAFSEDNSAETDYRVVDGIKVNNTSTAIGSLSSLMFYSPGTATGFAAERVDGDNMKLHVITEARDGNPLSLFTFDGNQSKVGILTKSPQALFHVTQGVATIGGNDLTQSCILAGSSAEGIGIDNNEIIKKGGNFVIGNCDTDGAIYLRTNLTDRVVVANNTTTVNNLLQANGGVTIATNEDNDTPELTLKRYAHTSAGGNDDICDIRVGDSTLSFYINNDDDADAGQYHFYKMANGAASYAPLVASNLHIDNNIVHIDDGDTYFGFHANDEWRVVTGGSERLEVTNDAINLRRNTGVTGSLSVSHDLTVDGDLTVNGDVVTLNTTNLDIEDKVIKVAKNATTNQLSDESGIAFGSAARLLYDSGTDALYIADCLGLLGGSIKSNTITATQIAANAVGSSELADDAVDTAAVVDKAITGAKIADNTIGAGQIAANAVGSSELADDAVDTAAVVNKAITAAKIADNTIGAGQIAANAVGSSELADNAVDTAAVVNKAITGAKIADNTITAGQIADNTIGAGQIAANAVGASELDVSGNGSSGQVLKSDGDGSFSWGTAYTHPTFTAGTAGSSTQIPVISVNSEGHVDSLSFQNVEIPSSSDFVQTAVGAQTMNGYLQVKGQNSSSQSIIADYDIVAMANASDERLKENVVKIDSALDKVCSLEGFSFDWNDEARKFGIKLDRKEVGLSAQATEKVVPEAVKTFDNSDYKYINYEKLVPVLVEAIKDLKSEIEELKKNNCGCN